LVHRVDKWRSQGRLLKVLEGVLRRALRPRGADEASGDARARQGRRQLHAGAAVAEVQPRRPECHLEKVPGGGAPTIQRQPMSLGVWPWK
jgi:hypothetical protein